MEFQISELSSPRIAIDGFFFQIGKFGIARVWYCLLSAWVKSGFAKHLLIIDRGGTAPKFPGVNYYQTPLVDLDNLARESIALQAICDREKIDLFMSTCYTTPLTTPSLCLVHDLLQEVMEIELNTPTTQEKFYAIYHATKYFAVSEHTAKDLQRFFPHILKTTITTTLNGVSSDFYPPSTDQIQVILARYKIFKPYFLVVGERYGYLTAGERHYYKNAIHVFQAVAELPNHQAYLVVCVGGNRRLEPEIKTICRRANISVQLLSLDDQELQSLYGGAIALVYPSLYEGFGLPILESLACGCPVITCHNSAIPEVAGDAAIYISGEDVGELTQALQQIQQPEIRQKLITAGLARSKQFSWAEMAAKIAKGLLGTYVELQAGELPPHNPMWLQSRKLHIYQSGFWKLHQQWFKLKRIWRFATSLR